MARDKEDSQCGSSGVCVSAESSQLVNGVGRAQYSKNAATPRFAMVCDPGCVSPPMSAHALYGSPIPDPIIHIPGGRLLGPENGFLSSQVGLVSWAPPLSPVPPRSTWSLPASASPALSVGHSRCPMLSHLRPSPDAGDGGRRPRIWYLLTSGAVILIPSRRQPERHLLQRPLSLELSEHLASLPRPCLETPRASSGS
ncbi:hypothetical protein BT67DRAFT_146316 [Trichocladium antarcticum]|uniref:Uncharacterized protein n=1 Tax=Trichocladium antarcticum TaxID=1450529 RepID=A0AAN6ZB12_9PEZI|nr:hypothetical protein BT67DRAFT_146316 [Trichocladium antarcticum]